MSELTVHAPAKINLVLKIIRKRADGYHDIQSILQKVSLYDTLVLKSDSRQGIRVTTDNPLVPTNASNLAYQAADLFLRQQKIVTGLSIHIKKRIPVGAGLGGGSTNAAATLAGLNNLLNCNVEQTALFSLGIKIGADVPFFINNMPAALAEGIGERLTPVKIDIPLWIIIVFPGFSISTKWAYENYKVLTNTNKKINMLRHFKGVNDVIGVLGNDLESIVTRRYPEIQKIKHILLQAGACGALMSGSGSAVFGIFSDEQHAREAFQLFRMPSYKVFIVRSL